MGETSSGDALSRAQSALTSSSSYDLRRLRVERCNGSLVISGIVSRYYHKQLAQELVLAVCGGLHVINVIDVRQGAA